MWPDPLPAQQDALGAPPPAAAPTPRPLPAAADLGFWRTEVERSQRDRQTHESDWDENLRYYTGQPLTTVPVTDYVNVNVDFYQVEQKLAQLFYETPDLQIEAKTPLEGQDAWLQLHRRVLNELLSPDETDALRTVLAAIKNCLCTAGIGPTILGFQPTTREIQPPPQFGALLGLKTPIQVPIHQALYWTAFSPKKLLIPADFHESDWDAAPWLGMEFRLPLTVARREFGLPPDFTGTNIRDEHILNAEARTADPSGLNYVDGQVIWYKTAVFDETEIHPDLYSELVLIDGLDAPARHRPSPHQRVGPQGQLTPDSLMGNPIHPLTIRDVPDSAFTPSDSQMTRPLVKELCLFRTQMVKERDANRPKFGYDSEKLTPETVAKLEKGEVGDMIPLEGGALAQGIQSIMAPFTTGSSPRQTYMANDYITRDIAKTLALDATNVGVRDDTARTATEIASVDRSANVRLDAERRQVLRWYLKGVQKLSALSLRYLPNSGLLTEILGQQAAMAWQQGAQQAQVTRMGFSVKPDSQIRLDASQERKFKLSVYQMVAQDPNVVRVELLKELLAACGYDPQKVVVEKLPSKTPEPNISFRFSGDDLANPMVREILAQGGFQISQPAVDAYASQQFKQVALGLRDVGGKVVPPKPRLAEHGGPTESVRPLTKQQGDETPRGPAPGMVA